MDWISVGFYGGVLTLAAACSCLSRITRLPGSAIVVAVGLVLGRTGLGWIESSFVHRAGDAIAVHVAIVLTVLGAHLGGGMLRRPALEIAKHVSRPLLLAAVACGVGAVVLPLLLPDAEPDRSFRRFFVPLALVFAAFPLLVVRDLRGRPPAENGGHFVVAVALAGAVYSFTPMLLWAPNLDLGVFWRTPVLVLGESGALGIGAAVIHLFLTRQLGFPAIPVLLALSIALIEATFRMELWFPFAGLALGVALGRTAASLPRVLENRRLFSELPFLLAATLAFAPDLFLESLTVPVAVHTVYLAAILLVARAAMGGSGVTGPGLLFLGLTLTVRLSGRMSPLGRYTVDFALPAWIVLRSLLEIVRHAQWRIVAVGRGLSRRRAERTARRARARPPRPRA